MWISSCLPVLRLTRPILACLVSVWASDCNFPKEPGNVKLLHHLVTTYEQMMKNPLYVGHTLSSTTLTKSCVSSEGRRGQKKALSNYWRAIKCTLLVRAYLNWSVCFIVVLGTSMVSTLWPVNYRLCLEWKLHMITLIWIETLMHASHLTYCLRLLPGCLFLSWDSRPGVSTRQMYNQDWHYLNTVKIVDVNY